MDKLFCGYGKFVTSSFINVVLGPEGDLRGKAPEAPGPRQDSGPFDPEDLARLRDSGKEAAGRGDRALGMLETDRAEKMAASSSARVEAFADDVGEGRKGSAAEKGSYDLRDLAPTEEGRQWQVTREGVRLRGQDGSVITNLGKKDKVTVAERSVYIRDDSGNFRIATPQDVDKMGIEDQSKYYYKVSGSNAGDAYVSSAYLRMLPDSSPTHQEAPLTGDEMDALVKGEKITPVESTVASQADVDQLLVRATERTSTAAPDEIDRAVQGDKGATAQRSSDPPRAQNAAEYYLTLNKLQR